MLTVLIRYKKSRTETLQEVAGVEYFPPDGDDVVAPGLLLRFENGQDVQLAMSEKDDENWRDVFVMNSQGQTVARYTL